LRKILEEKTNQELIVLLETLDPDAAASIDKHNKRRIIRALEVTILSGEPFSKQKKKGEPLFEVLQIGIDVSRDILYKRIDERIEKMVDDGLLQEIKMLLRRKYHWDLPSMKGIGYQEFRGYVNGEYDLSEAIRLLKKNTHDFARRQLTWFRRDKRIRWCQTYEEAEALVDTFLKT
jgi:tRNA dimethylallyltransferase